MSAEAVIAAFSQEQVEGLTGLSSAQLRYWDSSGFFKPYHSDGTRGAYARVYSFKDVVGLRTLSVLRGGYGVSLQHLKQVAEKLSAYSSMPWAEIRLKVWNKKVQFEEPETGKTRGVVDGQYVLLPIIDVIAEMEAATARLRSRAPDQIGQIARHRFVSHNALVVAGTRIPVKTIAAFAAEGYSPAQIIAEYPQLTEPDIQAALRASDAERAA